MNFATKEELYQTLYPVFKVKERLLKMTRYKNISDISIWNYLIQTKWKYCHNLTISEVVNDIIVVRPEKILDIIGGKNEN